ncbi:MAG: NAD(P)-dependent oxidoreductase [Bacteroidota bacterium]
MGRIESILLTGGNGFLGSHILKQLLMDNYSVVLLLRSTSDLWRIEQDVKKCKVFIVGETGLDLFGLLREQKIDAVIHTATEYGRDKLFSDILETNVLFPVKLLEAASKNGSRLFINTDSFFAKKGFEQTYLSQYTDSKRILEHILRGNTDEISVVNMRIEHVFGPLDSENKFVTSVIHQLIKGNNEIKLTEGLQKRDFVYVEDVANAYIKILKNANLSKLNYQEFEVGNGFSITVREFVQRVAEFIGSSSKLSFGALPPRIGDIEDSFADLTALKKIGWYQSFQLDVALKKIVTIEKERIAI